MNQPLFAARTGSTFFFTVALCLLTAATVLPTSALAQQKGYTSKYVNLRAGPSEGLPDCGHRAGGYFTDCAPCGATIFASVATPAPHVHRVNKSRCGIASAASRRRCDR